MNDELLLNLEHCSVIKYQGLYDMYFDKSYNRSEIFVKDSYNYFLTFIDNDKKDRVILDPISGKYSASTTGDQKITIVLDGLINPLSSFDKNLRKDEDEDFKMAYRLIFEQTNVGSEQNFSSAESGVEDIDFNKTDFVSIRKSELNSPITEKHIREIFTNEQILEMADDRNMGNERATITRLRFGVHGLIAEYIENANDLSLKKGISESNKGHGDLWDEEKMFDFIKSHTALIDPDFDPDKNNSELELSQSKNKGDTQELESNGNKTNQD